MNTYIVYKHQNQVNGKIYIGITKYGNNPNYRWRNGMGYLENSRFFEDIVKYGWDQFSHEILLDGLNITEAIKMEKEFIQKFNSASTGYNISAGGQALSEEGCKKISQALTGIKRNQNSIDKQMQTKKDRYGSQRGVHAYATSGKKVLCKETGDVFASISEAERWSRSCKVGECCHGKRQHAGTHPETKEQLSWEFADPTATITIICEEDREMKCVKRIQCINTLEVFDSASHAALTKTGKKSNASSILRCCNGERQSCGKDENNNKLKWRYYEEE